MLHTFKRNNNLYDPSHIFQCNFSENLKGLGDQEMNQKPDYKKKGDEVATPSPFKQSDFGYCNCAFAASTTAVNPAGSLTARSAMIFLSSATSAFFKP